jgi:hypothetical protein
MKTKVEEIDKLIEQALSEEEADYLKQLEEESLPEMLLGLYTGKNRWMAVMTAIYIFVAFGFAIYFGYKFFSTDSIEMMLKWGFGALFMMIMVSLLKMWNWMQIDKNTLIKHIKHLEYQLTVVASKLEKK